MNTQTRPDDTGYSPPIKIELHLHGECFNVASIGPDKTILRDARIAAPGVGIVRFDVDGRITIYNVSLIQGIDPARTQQPISILGIQADAAA